MTQNSPHGGDWPCRKPISAPTRSGRLLSAPYGPIQPLRPGCSRSCKTENGVTNGATHPKPAVHQLCAIYHGPLAFLKAKAVFGDKKRTAVLEFLQSNASVSH